VPAGDGQVKVLWLIKGLGAGGAERLIWMFARTGDRARFDYEVAYVVPWASAMVPSIEAAGVPVHCLRGPRQFSTLWVVRLRRLLRQHRYDIVHAHSPSVAAVLRVLVRSIPRSQRPTVMSTEHCTWWSYRPLTRWANAVTCRLDSARIAVSTQVRESMWRRAREGVQVIVHGVMTEELVRMDGTDRELVRSGLGILPGEVLIATVGNFRSQKAYSDLLAAARQVVDGCSQARFVAIGYGPLESEVRGQHSQLRLGDRFLILGYRADVASVLAASDVFALASLYEGGPIALLEALAAGLPVVVTSVGFVPDIVREGVEGFVVPPGRPELLAERLGTLAADRDLRARMSLAATARGRSIRVEDAVHRVEATYRTLYASRSRSSDPAVDPGASA
jgi:glycosyltransferase involved in cell wall biosynthesis